MKVKNFISTSMIATLFAIVFTVTASAQTVVVTPANQQGWSTASTTAGGDVNFVLDSTAPAGNGALQLITDATVPAKAQYLHAANTPLASVTELSYFTRQVSGPPIADPSYQLILCLGGTSSGCAGFTTMVFEPYQNNGLNPPSPLIIPNVWQGWDVDAGQFWSTQNYNVGTCTVARGFGGPPFYTLPQLQANCPNAVAVGFGVNIGSNNPSYNVYTDLVNFNGTTYDFEPYEVATEKDQCKNGGWKNVFRTDGTAFRNQGDCIQFVNTGR